MKPSALCIFLFVTLSSRLRRDHIPDHAGYFFYFFCGVSNGSRTRGKKEVCVCVCEEARGGGLNANCFRSDHIPDHAGYFFYFFCGVSNGSRTRGKKEVCVCVCEEARGGGLNANCF